MKNKRVIARVSYEPDERPEFVFCESVHASVYSQWCIRRTTSAGMKLGGGIDTDSLCGRVTVKVGGWDLNVRITDHHLKHNACRKCLAEYQNLTTRPTKRPARPWR